MGERKDLVIIDGHALAYRHYYSIGKTARMTNAQGQNVGTVYGFIRHILDILRDQPDYLVVTFDRGLSGRDESLTIYKQNRSEAPADLNPQVEIIESLLTAFSIPIYTLQNYEADDVIGTLTEQALGLGCNVRIVTGDRDILQLLQPHVTVELPVTPKIAEIPQKTRTAFSVQGGDAEEQRAVRTQTNYVEWTEDTFFQEYDLRPYQLPDLKGIAGDTSDNIPGVQGIGEKGAKKILTQFSSLEQALHNIDRLDPKLAAKLKPQEDAALMMTKVATIHRHLEGVRFNPAKARTFQFSPKSVLEALQDQQFGKGIQNYVEQLVRRQGQADFIKEIEVYQSQTTFTPAYTVVDTGIKLAQLAEALSKATYLAVDTETTGLDKMAAQLVGISLSMDGDHAYYIPVELEALPAIPSDEEVQISLWEKPAPPPATRLSLALLQEKLAPSFRDPAIAKITHNGGYDYTILLRHGLELSPILEDTMLAQFVLESDRANLGLKRLATNKLGIKLNDIEELIGKGKTQLTFDQVPVAEAAKYAAGDAIVTYRLASIFTKELAESGNPKAPSLYREIEIPLIEVLCRMEMAGILVDKPYLKAMDAEFTATLDGLAEQIYALAGQRFNITSPKQLSSVLFEKMSFDTGGLKKTKQGNFSLTSNVLDDLAERSDHPIFQHLMEYRSLHKLLTTYIQALPELINPHTGRVHTSFNQVGAVTGRLSSTNPNLQNIPIRTEEGRRIRQAFLAAEGHLLLGIDYSQIELRILAHYSGDEKLKEAFRQGVDVHASTAATIFKVPLAEVTSEQRRFAKAVNFGLIYGMGAYRLARDSNFTLSQANQFIKDYFAAFPSVQAYLETTKQFAQEQGYVETLFGRRRDFSQLQQGYQLNAPDRARMEREAINAPIQGTAAEIMKRAMIEVHRYLNERYPDSAMLLQVHDELVLEVPESDIEDVQADVARLMEAAGDVLSVPLLVEAHYGRNWIDL